MDELTVLHISHLIVKLHKVMDVNENPANSPSLHSPTTTLSDANNVNNSTDICRSKKNVDCSNPFSYTIKSEFNNSFYRESKSHSFQLSWNSAVKETHPQTEIHILMGGNVGFWSRSIRLGDQWFIAWPETLLGFSVGLLGDEHMVTTSPNAILLL